MNALLKFLRNEDGPTAVEYAVMLAMILGVVFASVTLLGKATTDSFAQSRDSIDATFNPDD